MQRRALAATVVLRGTVVAPDTIEVMPVASARGRPSLPRSGRFVFEGSAVVGVLNIVGHFKVTRVWFPRCQIVFSAPIVGEFECVRPEAGFFN